MKQSTFEDKFGARANAYSQFRPTYPLELFAALAAATPEHELAWDCAAGSGQATRPLTQFYNTVLATDASYRQLQGNAATKSFYVVQANAEAACVSPASIDLLVVAQALHWFHLPAFFAMARQALKPGAVFAAWTYNLLHIDGGIDPLVKNFYHKTLGPYWASERRMVDSGYAEIDLPFAPLDIGTFSMTTQWTLDQLCGYLSTWSALQSYRETKATDPLPELREKLARVWGDAEASRTVRWPLSVKAGVNTKNN